MVFPWLACCIDRCIEIAHLFNCATALVVRSTLLTVKERFSSFLVDFACYKMGGNKLLVHLSNITNITTLSSCR